MKRLYIATKNAIKNYEIVPNRIIEQCIYIIGKSYTSYSYCLTKIELYI